MFFFKAAMRWTVLLVLLMVTLSSSCVEASLNNKQVHNDEINSLYLFHTENYTLHLTWNLLSPFGAVRGYRVTWNDGLYDRQTHVSEAEVTIEYPSNLDCYDEFTVNVMALDDNNIPIGNDYQKRIALQDVVTDVILTPEENRISASWFIKCPSQEVTDIVVIWEEVTHSHELSCHFPSTATDTTAPTFCTAGEQILQPCMSYRVMIEPLDSSSNYIGISGEMLSDTLEEGSGSKLVETMKLKDTSSRSVTLLWKGPNPECHGGNYVVTYTATRLGDGQTRKGHVKVVKWSKWSKQNTDQAITANLHPSDNGKVMAHMDNLQPFTEYEFCVAAGNGVTNLACLRAETMERKPEKPTHFVTANEQSSSTTIAVMWKKQSNMNGKLVNYIVRWHQDSKHSGSHNTTKLSYTIVDAEPCVDYTITVTAVNGAGEGEAAQTRRVVEDDDCYKKDFNQDSEVVVKDKKDDAVSKQWVSTSWWFVFLSGVFVGIVITLVIWLVVHIFNRRKDGASQKKHQSEGHNLTGDPAPKLEVERSASIEFDEKHVNTPGQQSRLRPQANPLLTDVPLHQKKRAAAPSHLYPDIKDLRI